MSATVKRLRGVGAWPKNPDGTYPKPQNPDEWERFFSDPMARICSGFLYQIMTKAPDDDDEDATNIEPFRPNRAQRRLLSRLWVRNVILKARQLGFTTLVCIMFLDHALFVPNQRCVMVAQDLPKATSLFNDKVKFAFQRLPEEVRSRIPAGKINETTLELANNSKFEITNSARSGTVHRLHVSEMGKIGATHPRKAKEIVTGSFPAVPLKGGMIIVESTAEGQAGEFYKIVQRALRVMETGKKLNERDFRLTFSPWHEEPGYVLTQHQPETKEDSEYFAEVEKAIKRTLSREQRNWYIATRDADFSGDEEKMWQEYPSTPEEPFKVSLAGTYYAKQLTAARKQKRIVPHVPVLPGIPCFTFWDIGNSDGTAIWVLQYVGMQWRAIRFKEGWGEPYEFYAQWLQGLGLTFATHFLPHDADHTRQGATMNESPQQMLQRLLPGHRFDIVPRIDDVNWGIQQTRAVFPMLVIDSTECKEGVIHLENYRKKWNEQQQIWSREPDKTGGHSEAADALRQFAQAHHNKQINMNYGQGGKKKRPGNWRVA